MKYHARSASNKTEDWPFWFVANHEGLNVTVQLVPELRGYLPFLPRADAEQIAERANTTA